MRHALGPYLPPDWTAMKLKRVAHLKAGEAITADAIEQTGEYPVYGGNGLRGYTSACTHEGDFILVGRQGALCGNVNRVSGRFWASEHAIVLTPTAGHDVRWLGWVVEVMNLNRYSQSAAQPGLSVDTIRELLSPVPPPREQRAIADFLDRETARIDALVAKKLRLIELLQERKQDTVDRLTAPAGQGSETGEDLFLPAATSERWHAGPLKRFVPSITVGIVITPAKYYVDQGIPCLRGINVSSGVIKGDAMVYITEESNRLHEKSIIHAGDLVVVRTGRTGLAAVVTLKYDGANCVDLLIVRKSDRLMPKFLWYYLQSTPAKEHVRMQSEGALQPHYNTETLATMPVPVPAVPMQDRVIAALDERLGEVDRLVASMASSVELLTERRQALMTAAVTGQLDIAEAAA